MNGAMRGFGVHPLSEEAEILHLLANETAGEADLLTANDDDLLAIKELLRYD